MLEGKTRQIKIGRGERIWTFDPHNPIVVRYQAALRPDTFDTLPKQGREIILEISNL